MCNLLQNRKCHRSVFQAIRSKHSANAAPSWTSPSSSTIWWTSPSRSLEGLDGIAWPQASWDDWNLWNLKHERWIPVYASHPLAAPFLFCVAFFMSFLGFTLMFHFDHVGLLLEMSNTHWDEFCACSYSQNIDFTGPCIWWHSWHCPLLVS